MVRDTCYYDAQCGSCRRTAACLRALDWLHRLEFRDLNAADDLPVGLDVALSGMPMRTRDGRVLVGFAATRRALLRTPAGALVAWALYLPLVSGLAAKTYASFARRRRRACRV